MSRRTIAPREAFRGTREDLAAVGVDYRSEDLFTGRSASPDGPTVHFGLARLTDASLAFWRDYRLSSGRVTDLLALLAVKLQKPSERLDFDALTQTYGWSRGELEQVAATIRQHNLVDKRVFRNIKGGVVGLEWLLDEEFAETEDRFVAYASRAPLGTEITAPLPDRSADPAIQLREHAARFSDLLLTVGVATARGLPTVTHFGIFRNPLAFLDPDSAYRGLAMQLHGFAATVSLNALADKQFLITEPMPVMTRILRQELAPDEVYEGQDDAGVREYVNRRLPPGIPPIREEQRYSWAGFTLDASTTVVNLRALASYYRPD